MNELELDDQWQRSVFDRLLKRILIRHAHQGQIVFIGLKSKVGSMLQRQAHIDMTAQLPDDSDIAIELKIVRWPGAKRGTPAQYHYKDLFLETYSCTVPNHETRGWLYSSKADILLWCQCAFDERSINCWPFPFQRLQRWHDHHKDRLETRDVENIINGHALWTRGHLASIQKICRDLKVEGFKIDQNGLISDLWGAPLLRFLGEA